MASVPPYDVYIFIAFIVIGLGIAACIVKCCCCCCPKNTKRKNTTPPKQSSPHSDAEDAEEGRGKYKGNNQGGGAGADGEAEEDVEEPVTCVQFIIRMVIAVFIVIPLAFFLLLIIFAILGSSGFGEILLFSPKVAGECSTSCTYTSKNGLSGWVDESCCTYEETLPGMTDVYITGEGGETIHGYLMVNRTMRFPGQQPSSLLYSHGSGNNVAAGYRLRKYEFLLSLGNVAIFVYDYHGYGRSTGTAGPASAASAAKRAGRWFGNWTGAGWPATPNYTSSTPALVNETSPELDLSRIILIGESMGGCLTSTLAKEAGFNVKGMLYFATFLHLKRLAEDYWPIAGWAMGSVLNEKYPEYNNEVQINSGSTEVCRLHAHSPDDEWVKYDNHAQQLYSVGKKNSTCSRFIPLEAGTIHTQPFTATQSSAMSAWIAARR